jgi:COP9 signalosome complex subunit 5
MFSDPWLAVVVDPLTTMSAGKVDIGAFRLYPQGYKPSSPPKFRQDAKSIMSIRSDKEKDYGAHSDRYYELDMQFFKSSTQKKLLDILWLKFWVQTLSSSSLLVVGGPLLSLELFGLFHTLLLNFPCFCFAFGV